MDTIETTIYTAVLITAIVIGAILIYFAVTIFRSHRKYFKMLRRQFLAEMELLEKERNRIAKDLHDELGPLLTVARMNIETAEGVSAEDRKHLEKAREEILSLNERFAEIAKNLTPRSLVSKGLQTALEDFFDQCKEVSPIKMELIYAINSRVYINTSLQVFRMVQEMLHNAMKHSEASELTVQLKERKGKIYLFYRDDGKGIDPGTIRNQTGIGLGSLQSRAEMLGGKMIPLTGSKKGTEYLFEIPLIISDETTDTHSTGR